MDNNVGHTGQECDVWSLTCKTKTLKSSIRYTAYACMKAISTESNRGLDYIFWECCVSIWPPNPLPSLRHPLSPHRTYPEVRWVEQKKKKNSKTATKASNVSLSLFHLQNKTTSAAMAWLLPNPPANTHCRINNHRRLLINPTRW